MMMKPYLIFAISLLTIPGFSQNALTLQACYEMVEANYPLVRQRHLIDLASEYSVSNAAKGSWPRIAIGGQATYQSDVTQIPFEMPGIEPLNKDQYRIFAEVTQTVYNGGVVEEQKRVEELSADVDRGKLEVDLYAVRSRVNELFFGILLLREQRALAELKKSDISAALKKVQASVDNGSALKSDAAALRAEVLRLDQRLVEISTAIQTYREMLGLFIGQPLSADTRFEQPVLDEMPSNIDRFEMRLFERQKQLSAANKNLLSARKRPRLELFVQAGYGRPGLNMLENEFNFFYLGGLRLSWALSGYYTWKREEQLLTIRQQSLDVQQETFLFNTGLDLNRHRAEIEKQRKLLEVDRDIVDLRTQVREAAEVQLEEGVITSADFVREVNAEDEAKQNLALHQIELLLAKTRYYYTAGYKLSK